MIFSHQFSIISFRAFAGLLIISPAAILLTTTGSSFWITDGSKSLDSSIFLFNLYKNNDRISTFSTIIRCHRAKFSLIALTHKQCQTFGCNVLDVADSHSLISIKIISSVKTICEYSFICVRDENTESHDTFLFNTLANICSLHHAC